MTRAASGLAPRHAHSPETLSLLSPGTPARPLGLVAHADWSLRADKRWVCVAAQGPDGWRLDAPVLVGDVAEPEHLLSTLVEQARGRAVLVGLDAGLGLPAAWGQRAGVEAFLPFLQQTVHEAGWERFWEPAASREEISLQRPFYPRRPGGTRQHHLVEGLGLDGPQALRRLCDQPRAGSPTPCPLFWTLGANQVGKATLAAWRTVVVPGLVDPTLDLRVWPFSGELEQCLDGDVALAEVYPGEVAAWLGMQLAAHGGKRSRGRKAQGRSSGRPWTGLGWRQPPAPGGSRGRLWGCVYRRGRLRCSGGRGRAAAVLCGAPDGLAAPGGTGCHPRGVGARARACGRDGGQGERHATLRKQND